MCGCICVCMLSLCVCVCVYIYIYIYIYMRIYSGTTSRSSQWQRPLFRTTPQQQQALAQSLARPPPPNPRPPPRTQPPFLGVPVKGGRPGGGRGGGWMTATVSTVATLRCRLGEGVRDQARRRRGGFSTRQVVASAPRALERHICSRELERHICYWCSDSSGNCEGSCARDCG